MCETPAFLYFVPLDPASHARAGPMSPNLPWSITAADKPGLNPKQPHTGPLGLLSPARQSHEGRCAARRGSPLGCPGSKVPEVTNPWGTPRGGPPVFSTASLAAGKGSWPSLFPARRNKSLRNFSWVHSSYMQYEGLESQA